MVQKISEPSTPPSLLETATLRAQSDPLMARMLAYHQEAIQAFLKQVNANENPKFTAYEHQMSESKKEIEALHTRLGQMEQEKIEMMEASTVELRAAIQKQTNDTEAHQLEIVEKSAEISFLQDQKLHVQQELATARIEFTRLSDDVKLRATAAAVQQREIEMSSTETGNLNDQIKQQKGDIEVIQLANEQLEATAQEQTENMRSYQDELEQREHEDTRAEAKFAELVANIQEYQTTKAKALVLSWGIRKGTHNSRPRTRRYEKEIDGSKVPASEVVP